MSEPESSTPELPPCPICAGRLDVVYSRYHQIVAVCVDCHAGITAPTSAWEVKRLKHEQKWKGESVK